MNLSSHSDDDRSNPTPDASGDAPAYRVALIDLTTSQLVIAIGEPTERPGIELPDVATEQPAQHLAGHVTGHRAGMPAGSCTRGPRRRRTAVTRARHLDDGSGCR